MPPAKVRIERISGDRTRQNTFHKRKLGLIKKAIELTVLCDCDCAIILRSGPTVTCREGRLMAYCNKDLEKMLKSCIENPPPDYYTNASYSRFSKDGDIVLDEGDGAAGRSVAALEMEGESSLYPLKEGGQEGGEDADELRQRMKSMEEELNRLRAMVPQTPGSQSATQHEMEAGDVSRSDSFKQADPQSVLAVPISSTGAAETSSAQHASAEPTEVTTPQGQAPVKLERQSSAKKRQPPPRINPNASPGQTSVVYTPTGNWSGAKRRIKDHPAENIGRIGRANTFGSGEKQEATDALQAALFGVMSSTNVAEPPSQQQQQQQQQQHPFMDEQGQQHAMFVSSDMVPAPAQPHSGGGFGEEYSGEPAHRPAQAWQLPPGYHPHPHSQTGLEQSEHSPQHFQQNPHPHASSSAGFLSQPASGASLMQPGSWAGMQGLGMQGHALAPSEPTQQLGREDSWDLTNMLGTSTPPQKNQWQEEQAGWSPGKPLLSPLMAQPGSGGPGGGGLQSVFAQHLPEGSPKN